MIWQKDGEKQDFVISKTSLSLSLFLSFSFSLFLYLVKEKTLFDIKNQFWIQIFSPKSQIGQKIIRTKKFPTCFINLICLETFFLLTKMTKWRKMKVCQTTLESMMVMTLLQFKYCSSDRIYFIHIFMIKWYMAFKIQRNIDLYYEY